MIREAIEELNETKIEPGNVGLKGLTRRCTIYYGTPGSSAYKTASQFADFTYDMNQLASYSELLTDNSEFLKAVENGTSIIFDEAQHGDANVFAVLDKFLTDDRVEIKNKTIKINPEFKMIFVVTVT